MTNRILRLLPTLPLAAGAVLGLGIAANTHEAPVLGSGTTDLTLPISAPDYHTIPAGCKRTPKEGDSIDRALVIPAHYYAPAATITFTEAWTLNKDGNDLNDVSVLAWCE